MRGVDGEPTWVSVPPVPMRDRLVVDTHDALGHCGRDKLLEALRFQFWWPAMHLNVQSCLQTCATCQRASPPKQPVEDYRAAHKGTVPLQAWAIDLAGPFPADADGNVWLAVAVDPFSKWIEARPIPSKHSWRVAEFLWEEIVCRWGRPSWVRTDNGTEFAGSFEALVGSLGV